MLLCLPLLLLGSGCGKNLANRGAIGGEVKVDGLPLENGSILFTPLDGTVGIVTGGQILNGRYQVSRADGPMTGEYRVQISGFRKTGKMVQIPLAPPGKMAEETVDIVPARFNTDSTLKVEIKPGDNTANFEVASK